MSVKIETIIFDLGGVLVDWKPEYLYSKIFNGDQQKTDWFLKNVCTPEWNVAQDAGRTIKEGNLEKIKEFPEYEKEITLFYERWTEMFSGPIQGTLDIFEAIKKSKKYNYYALTNWSSETWPIALKLFPFFNTFQGVVVSGEEKTRKPFAPIYNTLLNRFNISPNTAVFIDDNYDNVIAAKKLGIHGIHFTTPENLLKELEKLSVKF